MDAHDFDALLRTFSQTPSRRHALRFLAGGVLAGLLSLDPLQAMTAKTMGKNKGKGAKGKGKKKEKPRPTCAHVGDHCGPKTRCCSGTCCAEQCLPSYMSCCREGGDVWACAEGNVCSDPTSTAHTCAQPGRPVCCLSDLRCTDYVCLCHPVGTTCCSTSADGNGGVCEDPAFPLCCPPEKGAGCCSPEKPVCCSDNEGAHYCCPNDTVCCPGLDDSGCCIPQ